MTSVEIAILEHLEDCPDCPSIWYLANEIGVPYYWVHNRVNKLAAAGILTITRKTPPHPTRIALSVNENSRSAVTGHNG